jgi:putative transposase
VQGGHRLANGPGQRGGRATGLRGAKKINGRKRHLVVDSLLLVVLVTGANADDGTTAPEVLQRLTREHRSRLDEVRGDGKYRNRALQRYLAREQVGYRVTVVERPTGAHGLVQLPYRWSSCGPTRGRGRTGATARMTSGPRRRARRW